MKLYLAGPMRGIPYMNIPAFLAAAAKLRADGHEVFCPGEVDIERAGDFYLRCPTGSTAEVEAAGAADAINLRACLRLDLAYILDHAEAIALLPGWERSKGVAVELAVTRAIGLPELVL